MKMQTFRKPHQWLTFWLEKYIEVLNDKKIEADTRKKYWTILKAFLEEHPGNPRNLALNDVHAYIAADHEERLVPISLFFKHIAPSRPHLEMLKKFNKDSTLAGCEPPKNIPLEQFEASLQNHKLSDRTKKNYCNAVAGYIKWVEENKLDSKKPHIEPYCEFLTNIRQLAPRTIAMHQTALKLFLDDGVAPPADT